MKICLLITLALCVLGSNARSQSADNNDFPETESFTKPSSFMGPAVTAILIGGFAAAASARSESPTAASATLETAPMDWTLDWADYYGDGLTLGGAALGLIAVGQLTQSNRMSATGVDMTRSLITTSVVVWGVKYGVNRPRPNGGRYSFPSGHTAAAFSVAPVLHKHFGWGVGAAAYGVATLTGAARMEENRHYLSDVVFGAALGIASGYWAVSTNKPLRFLDYLVVDRHGAGMSVSF